MPDLIIKGPQAQEQTVRLNRLDSFVGKLNSLYPNQILAIGLYGSMARGQDLPYSDIELFCVVDIPGMDTNFEWIYGEGKAEINVLGLDIVRQQAGEVDEKWALSKGQFLNARCIAGDAGILEELRTLSLALSEEQVEAEIRGITTGELYEWVGKLRNMRYTGQTRALPLLACKFTEMTALMLGLAHRRTYTTGMSMLEESLQLPDVPEGYGELCDLVMAGKLGDMEQARQALEDTWKGIINWERARGIEINIKDWLD